MGSDRSLILTARGGQRAPPPARRAFDFQREGCRSPLFANTICIPLRVSEVVGVLVLLLDVIHRALIALVKRLTMRANTDARKLRPRAHTHTQTHTRQCTCTVQSIEVGLIVAYQEHYEQIVLHPRYFGFFFPDSSGNFWNASQNARFEMLRPVRFPEFAKLFVCV